MIMSHEGSNFFTVLALMIGLGFAGSYMWFVCSPFYFEFFHLLFYASGLSLIGISILFAYAKKRLIRVILTIGSGILGGIHFYLTVNLFPEVGLILFAWMAFGLLLTVSGFLWLAE